MSEDRALQHALDLEALRNLGQRYARAADARDYDAMGLLFHPDAVIDGLRGTATLAEYLELSRSTPPAFEQSMHVLGDPLIELEVGADEATLDTYAVVYQIGATRDGGGNSTLGVRYLDVVERRDGEWRVRHRRTELRFMV
jgi:ketosteroid isomerase-like protein